MHPIDFVYGVVYSRETGTPHKAEVPMQGPTGHERHGAIE
jgi:hypothetical protein